MGKPTIVSVPGAWHEPEIYDQVLDLLEHDGHLVMALSLSSIGVSPLHLDLSGGIDIIRKCITTLVEDEGKGVVFVAHS